MNLRTILNIDVIEMGQGVAHPTGENRPSTRFFRMGEAAPGEGEWEHWGWALLITALVHVGALWVALAVTTAPPKGPKPEEPELVMLTYMAPRAQAAAAAHVPEKAPQAVPPPVRPRVSRPLVMPREPKPLPEPTPEPQKETPEETPEEAADVEDVAVGSEAVTGVVAGLVNSAVTTPGGSGLGVAGGEAVDLKQVARAPTVLKQVQPQYPREARSLRVEGLVLVRIIIGIDGRVEPEHTRIIRSVPALDAAAISAVTQWRFSPAIGRQGRPVRVIVEIPVQFSLK